jgi:hypothetical protein
MPVLTPRSYMRGIAYQQDYTANSTSSSDSNDGYKDPLADVDGCTRDIPILEQLRTNTIRVYALDPTANHTICMQMLADAGIYVVADLSQPEVSIDRDNPTWNEKLYTRYAAVIDEMSQYDNTLGFFAGNEVSNQPNNTDASAFVKAAVRDMKAYIKAQDYRTIGVGYATNDDSAIRNDMADYFDCGNRENAIDFWGLNIYSWCGDSSYTESGYDVQTKNFENYDVPVFFAEYGCNAVTPRKFTQVKALYGENMTGIWSGGIVYMYFQETNNYGLVYIDGSTVSKLPDFTYYSSEIATVSPTGVQMASYSASKTAAACPTENSDWKAESSPLPPTPNKSLCSCMYNSITCVPKSNLDDDAISDLFSTICGLDDGSQCDGITANATTGDYGAYSMCNTTEQLGWALNAYYEAQDSTNKASACDFDNSASIRATSSASRVCSSLMSEAGRAGTGVVTSRPTATGASDVSGERSSAPGSKSAAATLRPSSTSGNRHAILLFALGILSGFGMILL